MSEQTRFGIWQKRLSRGLSCLAMAVFVLTLSTQPARADLPVIDPAAIAQAVLTVAKLVAGNAIAAANYLQNEWNGVQVALQGAANTLSHELQVQAAGQIADTQDTNAAENVNRGVAEGIAVNYTRPSYYSWCHIAQGAALENNSEVGDDATGQAFALSNGNRSSDPVTNSQEIQNECNLCFAPVTDTTDPLYAAYHALGCKPCADTSHVRQDKDISIVIGPTQYLVDPALPLPKTTGQYMPLPQATPDFIDKWGHKQSYYPFLAALTFCQHLSAYRPKPPQATTSGKPTIDLLTVGAYVTAETQTSDAAGMCFRALALRMQYPQQGAATWPASQNYPASAGIQTRHDEQVAWCLESAGQYHLDSGTPNGPLSATTGDGTGNDNRLNECVLYGRSTMQGWSDEANIDSNVNYQTVVQATKSTDAENASMATTAQTKQTYKNFRETEKNQLAAAIGALPKTPFTTSATISQPGQ